MASMKGGRNTAIGLFVDGLEVKLAKLSIKRGNVVLDELHTATLVSKLEERQPSETSLESLSETSEAFALPTTETTEEEALGDNNSVLLGLLAKYPPTKYALGYAIAEPSIYYHVFESDFGLKEKKLKQRILDELRNVRAVQPALDAIDTFYSVDKNLVCVIREDGVTMLRTMEEIKTFMGNKLPRIPLIDSADVALMNIARANYGFAPDEITVIIYVGVEFTRLIFMKGTEFYHFAPILGEGYDSPNIQNTIYSRVLLEQDNMGIPRIDKVLLAGLSKRIDFDELIRVQLPDVEVQYLYTPYLDTSSVSPELQEQIPEYVIPIAIAWKILDEEHPAFYPINLLPESWREGQRVFKLAWHGYLLLALVFIATFFFTYQYGQLQTEVSRKQIVLNQLEEKVAENEKLERAIQDLKVQIDRYYEALAVYDSIVPGSGRWSKMVSHLTKGVEDLGALWITELRGSADGTMNMQGYSLYRARIPRIAALFDNSMLNKVEVKEIRDKTPPVYNFVINVPPQKEKQDVKISTEGQ